MNREEISPQMQFPVCCMLEKIPVERNTFYLILYNRSFKKKETYEKISDYFPNGPWIFPY